MLNLLESGVFTNFSCGYFYEYDILIYRIKLNIVNDNSRYMGVIVWTIKKL